MWYENSYKHTIISYDSTESVIKCGEVILPVINYLGMVWYVLCNFSENLCNGKDITKYVLSLNLLMIIIFLINKFKWNVGI